MVFVEQAGLSLIYTVPRTTDLFVARAPASTDSGTPYVYSMYCNRSAQWQLGHSILLYLGMNAPCSIFCLMTTRWGQRLKTYRLVLGNGALLSWSQPAGSKHGIEAAV
jgi:hypothetical protein